MSGQVIRRMQPSVSCRQRAFPEGGCTSEDEANDDETVSVNTRVDQMKKRLHIEQKVGVRCRSHISHSIVVVKHVFYHQALGLVQKCPHYQERTQYSRPHYKKRTFENVDFETSSQWQCTINDILANGWPPSLPAYYAVYARENVYNSGQPLSVECYGCHKVELCQMLYYSV